MASFWIGVVEVQLHIPGVRSLKDRRSVVISLRDRLRKRGGVACSVLPSDDPSRATLAATCVFADRAMAREHVSKIERMILDHAQGRIESLDGDVLSWPPEVFSSFEAYDE